MHCVSRHRTRRPGLHFLRRPFFLNRLKKLLHLWEFPVISDLRTNSAEMPVESLLPREPRNEIKGDAVVRVSRLRRKP